MSNEYCIAIDLGIQVSLSEVTMCSKIEVKMSMQLQPNLQGKFQVTFLISMSFMFQILQLFHNVTKPLVAERKDKLRDDVLLLKVERKEDLRVDFLLLELERKEDLRADVLPLEVETG